MRVMVVDNDRLLLDSLRLSIEARWSKVSVETAADEARALVLAASHGYELILLDWWLGAENAQACFARLRELCPDARIVVMSGDDSPDLVARALESGAAGFLRKNVSDLDTLRHALDVVMNGGIYLPGHSPGHGASPSVRGSAQRQLNELFPDLTRRQLEVLRVLLRGKADKQIARDLDIEVTTVKTHVQALFRVLGVTSRAEAVAQAARLGARID